MCVRLRRCSPSARQAILDDKLSHITALRKKLTAFKGALEKEEAVSKRVQRNSVAFY